MKIPFLNIEINSLKKSELEKLEIEPAKVSEAEKVLNEPAQQPQTNSSFFTHYDRPMYGNSYPVVTRSFDGEKTIGELGVIQHTIPDYKGLRLRAYDADMRTDLIKILVDRRSTWLIGSGLKLQSELIKEILDAYKVNLDIEKFQNTFEIFFNAYSNSNIADLKDQQTLHKLALTADLTAYLGGDCLVVLRVENNFPKVQIIDGLHIENPIDKVFLDAANEKGNSIKHGVEIDSNGKHVAYYVKKDNFTHERISAYGEKTGRKLAWMLYGDKKRVDHVRGVPKIATSIEKTFKMDRYTEATVNKAEQVANLVFAIEHDNNSTGEDPFSGAQLKSNPAVAKVADPYVLADGVARTINETTSGQALNLPVGAKMKSLANESEINFESFDNAMFNKYCATQGIPPEIARQAFNSNYTASIAAINTYMFNMDVDRNDLVNEFYKPILSLFLELISLQGLIDGKFFVDAVKNNNLLLIEAFLTCRFTAKKLPHIDPVKEVKAARLLLGDEFTSLTSFEHECEKLGLGDWLTNYKKYEKEKSIVQPLNNDKNAVPANNAVGNSGV